MLKRLIIKVGVVTDALKVIAPAMDGKVVVPVMDNVLIEVGATEIRFTGHNLNIGISLPVANALAAGCQPFAMLLEYKTLRNILQSLPTTEVVEFTLSDDAKTVNLVCDKSRYQLSCENPKDYARPEVPAGEGVQLNETAWGAVKRAVEACKVEQFSEPLEHVLLTLCADSVAGITGCNGHLLYLQTQDVQAADVRKALVPQNIIRAARGLKGNTAVLVEDDKRIGLQLGDVTVTTSKAAAGTYPDVSPLLVMGPDVITLSAVELAEAVRRLIAVAPDVTRGVTLQATATEIKLEAQNYDFSRQGSTTIPCKASELEKPVVKYNARFLLTLLDMFIAAGADEVQMTVQELRQTVLKTDDGHIMGCAMPLAP